MLRIHFTPEDLARTYVAADTDPMWEGALSLHSLHARTQPLVFRAWCRQVQTRTSAPVQRTLLTVNPPVGDFPDFLTPIAGVLGLDAGLEALLATPARRLRQDLERLDGRRTRSAWTRALADGDADTLRRFSRAVVDWHQVAIAPYWDRISARVAADRAVRARALQLGGVDRMLAGLPPPLRWSRPVLESPYPVDRDLHLGGRGLMLLPAFFCLRHPVTLIDAELPPVLAYPMEPDLDWLETEPGPGAAADRRLAALVGPTRSAALLALAGLPRTTGELARAVRMSPASASEHATVLRNAGLVATQRDGSHVLHTLTPLGIALLDRSG